MSISNIFMWVGRFLILAGIICGIFGADTIVVVGTAIHASVYIVGSYVFDKLEAIHDRLEE